MKHTILFVLLCLLFVSCRTITKVEYRDNYIDRYVTQVQHDTLRENTTDSVYVELLQKGDTIYSTKYKEVVRWRDRIVEKHDTCWRDSVVTEYKESIKEVRYIPKIYRISMGISVLLLIFAIVKTALWLKSKSII